MLTFGNHFATIRISVKRIFSRKRRLKLHPDSLGFVMASLTYIAAHIIDYLFTVPGVKGELLEDGNPIIQEYINHFGVEGGLLGYKLLICSGVILGMRAVDSAYRERETRLRAKYFLYGGAVLTTLGGSLWLWLY